MTKTEVAKKSEVSGKQEEERFLKLLKLFRTLARTKLRDSQAVVADQLIRLAGDDRKKLLALYEPLHMTGMADKQDRVAKKLTPGFDFPLKASHSIISRHRLIGRG